MTMGWRLSRSILTVLVKSLYFWNYVTSCQLNELWRGIAAAWRHRQRQRPSDSAPILPACRHGGYSVADASENSIG